MSLAVRAQQGAALLAAMLTVTLVASFAATALWQQWRAVEIETAERSRVQTAWVLTGALDWARAILREDARAGTTDHLGEAWAATPPETPLATFFAAARVAAGGADALPAGGLSIRLVDLQSRLNVRNLLEDNQVSQVDLRCFSRLFELLELPQAELAAMAEKLRLASDPPADTASGAVRPLMPQRVEQLVWLGLSPGSVARLAPHVSLLPSRTPVNLNTASAQVLYACTPDLALAQAERMVMERQRDPFGTLDDAMRRTGGNVRLSETRHSVTSRFFELRGRLRTEGAAVEERSLLERTELDVKALWRERDVDNTRGEPALQRR